MRVFATKVQTIRVLCAASLAASCFAANAVPSFALSSPGAESWVKGPDALGDNTYVGRVETPRASEKVAAGANLLVSGWAADRTAHGWSGFDRLEVWSGSKGDTGATKLADGSVGLPRQDVAAAIGSDYIRSGFSAVVPARALAALATGSQSLNIYLHTASKGWWHTTVDVTLPAAASEPINVFLRPLDGSLITQKQKFDKFTFFGYAVDLTPITDPGNQGLSSCECGIGSVAMYMDSIDAQHSLGNAAQNGLIAFANKGRPTYMPVANFSPVTRQYGRQYDKAGWAFSINPRLVSADWHTFYAVARSSITGKTSMAQVRMYIEKVPNNAKIVAP